MPKPDLRNCAVIEEFSVEAKNQAAGAQILDTRITNRKTGDRVLRHWQIHVELSATPAAGSLTVAIRSPGSSEYRDVVGTIDLTSSVLMFTWKGLADYVKLTPTALTADKTYSAFLSASE